MTTHLRPTTNILVRPHGQTGEGPTRRNAELTVFALGEDQDAIIPALQALGDFDRRKLARFQHLPVTLTLPNTYYDRSDAFVKLLRSSGTRFRIRSWLWLCPAELETDDHLCRETCMVQEMCETHIS